MVKHQLDIISRVLTPAVGLWLRSQLEKIEQLNIKIIAGDGEILRGKIEEVFISAEEAIYQGIYITKAMVKTEEIAVNLGGILRGKPLKLLHPLFIEGEINLTLDDLNQSLKSKLLTQGLIDLMILCLEYQGISNAVFKLKKYDFTWENINLFSDKLIINGTITEENKRINHIIITANFHLINDHILGFNPITIKGIPDVDINIKNFTVNLGNDVAIAQLTMTEKSLSCEGKIKIVTE